MSAMQSVPRGLASTIPLTMKYDHTTAYDVLALSISNLTRASSRAILMNTPYSPIYTAASPMAQDGASRNATFSTNMRDLYNQCVVINSEIRVDFHCTGTTPADMLNVGITPLAYDDVDAGGGGTWTFQEPLDQKALERYGTVYTPIRPGGQKSLVTSIAPHKLIGHENPLTDDTLHVKSADNEKPTAEGQVFWLIWASQVSATLGDDPAIVYAIITHRQTIVWFEPKQHTRTNN